MRVSSAVKCRPRAAGTPSVFSSAASTLPVRTRRGRSLADRFSSPVVNAPTRENERFHSVNSKYSGGEIQNWSKPRDGKRLVMNISRSGWGYPSGRRITPLTTEKIAVLAPIPSASVRMVTSANPGVRSRFRTA